MKIWDSNSSFAKMLPALAVVVVFGAVAAGNLKGTGANAAKSEDPKPEVLQAHLAPDQLVSGPEAARNELIRQKLLYLANKYVTKTDVPYIYGGGRLGSKKNCRDCRKCVRKQSKTPLEQRIIACIPCRYCGIDCSHFVNKIYGEAGLEFPFASTFELRRLLPESVKKFYGLVSLGKDLDKARTGDLLVYRNHVIMLLHMRDKNKGDFIHVTRFGDRHQLGGIRIETDRRLDRFRGKLHRILRHYVFFQEVTPEGLSALPTWYTPLNRLLAKRSTFGSQR